MRAKPPADCDPELVNPTYAIAGSEWRCGSGQAEAVPEQARKISKKSCHGEWADPSILQVDLHLHLSPVPLRYMNEEEEKNLLPSRNAVSGMPPDHGLNNQIVICQC
jgi:hypothetical protein